MAQLMRNAPQSRIRVQKYAGREVNSSACEYGKGELGPVGVKGISRLQELVVLEDDKGHRPSGTWERTELAA